MAHVLAALACALSISAIFTGIELYTFPNQAPDAQLAVSTFLFGAAVAITPWTVFRKRKHINALIGAITGAAGTVLAATVLLLHFISEDSLPQTYPFAFIAFGYAIFAFLGLVGGFIYAITFNVARRNLKEESRQEEDFDKDQEEGTVE